MNVLMNKNKDHDQKKMPPKKHSFLHQPNQNNSAATWLHDMKKEAPPELKAWLEKMYHTNK